MSGSPGGRWVVTTDLEQISFALDDPKQSFFSSPTLLKLDQATGALERAGDFAFDGVLPEMAVFDNSSRFLAVPKVFRAACLIFTLCKNSRMTGFRTTAELFGDRADKRLVGIYL